MLPFLSGVDDPLVELVYLLEVVLSPHVDAVELVQLVLDLLLHLIVICFLQLFLQVGMGPDDVYIVLLDLALFVLQLLLHR